LWGFELSSIFFSQAIGLLAARVVVLLTDASTEEMAHLRQEEVTVETTSS
jgi:hypothetical protein